MRHTSLLDYVVILRSTVQPAAAYMYIWHCVIIIFFFLFHGKNEENRKMTKSHFVMYILYLKKVFPKEKTKSEELRMKNENIHSGLDRPV